MKGWSCSVVSHIQGNRPHKNKQVNVLILSFPLSADTAEKIAQQLLLILVCKYVG